MAAYPSRKKYCESILVQLQARTLQLVHELNKKTKKHVLEPLSKNVRLTLLERGSSACFFVSFAKFFKTAVFHNTS